MSSSKDPIAVVVLTRHQRDEGTLSSILPLYRSLRLFALKNDPFSYSSTYADEVKLHESQWKARLLRPSVFHIVAAQSSSPGLHNVSADYVEGGWIGMVVVRRIEGDIKDDEKYVINALFVHPSARGRGIGRQLVKKCFEVIQVDRASRSQKAARVEIEVDSENATAFSLYQSVGFSVDMEQEGSVGGLTRREFSMSCNIPYHPH